MHDGAYALSVRKAEKRRLNVCVYVHRKLFYNINARRRLSARIKIAVNRGEAPLLYGALPPSWIAPW